MAKMHRAKEIKLNFDNKKKVSEPPSPQEMSQTTARITKAAFSYFFCKILSKMWSAISVWYQSHKLLCLNLLGWRRTYLNLSMWISSLCTEIEILLLVLLVQKCKVWMPILSNLGFFLTLLLLFIFLTKLCLTAAKM